MKPLIPTILIVTTASYFAYFTIHRIDHDVIFDGELQFLIGLVVLAIFCICLYKGIHAYRVYWQWTAFIPTITGIAINVGLLITLYLLSLRDRSPVQLSCVTKIADFNGAAFDFRNDGTYYGSDLTLLTNKLIL